MSMSLIVSLSASAVTLIVVAVLVNWVLSLRRVVATHLAIAILIEQSKQRIEVEKNMNPMAFMGFINQPKLIRMIGQDKKHEDETLDNISKIPMLVFDELGVSGRYEDARVYLQEILDARKFNYRNGLVITSNYSLDSLAEKLGNDAISSRIAGMCKVFELKGEDRRVSK